MDAKSKANFINSVAKGKVVLCPKCNTANEPGSKYCIVCGAELSVPAASDSTAAFAPVSEEKKQPAEQSSKYVEPVSAFAEGLPAWDILPPQIMVRRR